MLIEILQAWFLGQGIPPRLALLLADASAILVLLLCAAVLNLMAKKIILRIVRRVVARSSFDWDDVFLRTGVFTRLSHLAPVLVITVLGSEFFLRDPAWARRLETGVSVYLVVIVVMVLHAVLDAATELIALHGANRALAFKGFTQSAKLVIVLGASVLALSVLLGRSPLYFLSGLGALTAVLLLVFKDAILGFVAGVQLSLNRMVQLGDWIELPRFGVDGDVVDVSLTTVKVQNWDKAVTMVPTYALISEPVKNWRAMQEAGGRRIKRSILLDMSSFRFMDDALLKKLLTFTRLRPYLEQKLAELDEWNRARGEDTRVVVNGRRMTNVGCFRAYVTAYLQSNEHVHPEMTFLVRQLQPTATGLPLEIYVFTKDTRWTVHESVQADIFDHLLTVIPEFELRVFQSPSGNDLRAGLRG